MGVHALNPVDFYICLIYNAFVKAIFVVKLECWHIFATKKNKRSVMLTSHRRLLVAVMLSFFFVMGCSMTTVTSTWKNSEYSGKSFTSIMIVGLTPDPTNRLKWENTMAERLRQQGVQTIVTSLNALPNDRKIDKEEIIDYVNKHGIDGVLVTRLVDTKTETAYRSGSPYMGGGAPGYYGRFGGYYDFGYSQISRGPVSQTIVLLETNLYEVKSQELMWSMASDTIESNAVIQLIESASKKVGANLKKDQLI